MRAFQETDFKQLPNSEADIPAAKVEHLSTLEKLETACQEAITRTTERVYSVTAAILEAKSLSSRLEQNLRAYLKAAHDAAASLAQNKTAALYEQGVFVPVLSPEEIISRLNSLRSDLESFMEHVTTERDFKDTGIKLLDRYAQDTNNLEQILATPLRIVTNRREKTSNFSSPIDRIKKGEFENTDFTDGTVHLVYFKNQEEEDDRRDEIWDFYEKFREDWKKNQNQKQPHAIFYIPGNIPPYVRNRWWGVTIVSNERDLQAALITARDAELTRRQEPEFMKPSSLSGMQERLYDNSDLRQWEEKTADTKQSLSHFFHVEKCCLDRRKTRPTGAPYLDLGMGGGRMAVPLAMTGRAIVGLDISQNQLDKIKKPGGRVESDIAKYKTDAYTDEEAAGTSPLRGLVLAGEIPPEIIDTNAQTVSERIVPLKGDFARLASQLPRRLLEYYGNDYAKIMDLFKVPRSRRPYAYAGETTDIWGNKSPVDFYDEYMFSGVTMNWHTFCEAGTLDGQQNLINQIFAVTEPEGFVYIEIPDRTVGAYQESLALYHKTHPHEPYGTIRDETSTEEGQANRMGQGEDTPRFFPGRDQVVNLLRQAGFVNVEVDTYLITSRDNKGQEHFEVKELVITAQKPAAYQMEQ